MISASPRVRIGRMDRLEQLKTKYAAVLQYISTHNVRLDNLHVENDKLFLKGATPNEAIKNDVWNAIKAVDANYGDVTAEFWVDSSIPAPLKTYTVVAGDSLLRIAEMHLGNGAHYPKIIAANPGKLKDEKSVIHPGDVLVIPEN